MAESENGIAQMRRRMERGQRRPPPARRPASAAGDTAAPGPDAPTGEGVAPLAPAPATSVPGAAPIRTPARRALPTLARLAADEPSANLAIRVRRPLDERLVDLIHELRRAGVRTSKVELIEMLLWELPAGDQAALIARLAAFRRAAPRGPGAPLEA